MPALLVDIVAVALLALGLIVTTISLYGVLRMPDVYSQLHASGMASGLGVIAILIASIATRDAALITRAALVATFLLLTAPVASHAIAWAAYRRAARHRERRAEQAPPSRPGRRDGGGACCTHRFPGRGGGRPS
jgi:monovalent cation/proton antiporter MnhG/PhaG subunit